MLGTKLQEAIKSAGVTVADAAAYIGVSEANLYKLYKKDSFEVAYLRKAAELLNLPIAYFLGIDQTAANSQIGNFNQAGNSNIQKIKGNQGIIQANTGSTVNNIDDCRRDLAVAQKENELLRSQLADKERIIQLLEKSK